jgi:tetratricopeptide (TPR) repeat protein
MRGDHRAALDHFQQALDSARELGRRNAEMLYLNNLGGGQVAVGEYQLAEENLRRVIEMSETAKFGQISETYCFLADALLGQEKPDLALESGQRALALGRKSPEIMAAAWRVLGKIAARLQQAVSLPDADGQPGSYTAEACFAESDRICRETGMEGERAKTLRAWAQYDLEQGDPTRGMARWTEAREIFERIGASLEANRMAELPAQHSS